jgi:hypothetical protein
MNRHTRRALNLLANHIEDNAERLVAWLRAKAERKVRQKPLAFPTPMEEMMDRIFSPIIQQAADRAIREIMSGPEGLSALTGGVKLRIVGEDGAPAVHFTNYEDLK